MKSKIYIGHIHHKRYQPIVHELDYPLYLYALDLDELELLDRRYPFFGYNRLRPTSIYDADYLAPGKAGIRKKIGPLLQEKGITEPLDSVIMITSARYFNYVFNPVNFHYCFSKGEKLLAIIAEVNNTYGERHIYVLNEIKTPLNGFLARYQTEKAFHVSPFNKIEGRYDFYFSEIEDQLEIRIDLINNRQKLMAVSLKAKAVPMTRINHIKTLINYPMVPHLSIPRIYLEAFKLYFTKKLEFYGKPTPISPLTLRNQHPGIVTRLCRTFTFSALRKITIGCLTIKLPDGKTVSFGKAEAKMTAQITVKEYRFFQRLVLDGNIGLGESYVDGEWDTSDLVGLFNLLIHNRDQFSDGNFITSTMTLIKERFAHSKLRNTLTNSRDNIYKHYDLGNDFYQIFLDRHMIYSAAVFKKADESLEAAQVNKMEAIINKAQIKSTDHILEIGCGWGGFAIFAAQETGCRVTGITISAAQYQMACERVERAGLTGQITILLEDYRKIKGIFDKIVSIEMIESVGKEYLDQFFRVCENRLKPEGLMVLQAITMPDDRYEKYCKERDWIQKHIFPGGHLPSVAALRSSISENTDFAIESIDDIGKHYATTLNHWKKEFEDQKEFLEKQGFDAEFQRKWQYYFSICEAGFASNAFQDIHIVLKRSSL